MSSRRSILLVTDEEPTAEAVNNALEAEGRFATNGVCRDLQELTAYLQRKPVPAALVDIDTRPERMLSELERLTARFPETRFIVISNDLSSEMMLSAMQAGARHFLGKKSLSKELSAALSRLIPEEAEAGQRGGSITTVLSASGGCGATTIAINFANELHLDSGDPTLLVDMDLHYGAVASYLGVSGQYGLTDVLSHAGSIDGQLIRSTAVSYGEGVFVLSSPASADFGNPIAPDFAQLDAMLDACKQGFHYTVIDAPRAPMDLAAALAAQSSSTIIVFQLNVKDVRITREILMALTERGIRTDKLIPLANRCHRRSSMVTLDDAQRALGAVPLERIRNDYQSAIRGVNYGQPLSRSSPRSGMLKDIRELAGKLARASELRMGHTAR